MTRTVLYTFAVAMTAATLLAHSAEPRAPKHVTAEQAVACIKNAVAAKAGNVRELEAKVESNKTVCEVEIIASDGKKFEVYVDVASGKVLRVEQD